MTDKQKIDQLEKESSEALDIIWSLVFSDRKLTDSEKDYALTLVKKNESNRSRI